MAMTKKEKAEVQDLRNELRLAKALRWPDTPEPVRLPRPDRGYVEGWDFNAYSSMRDAPRVFEAWTEAYAHGNGRYPKDGRRYGSGSSQGCRRVYATREDALVGLRHALTLEVAAILAGVDAEIEKERTVATSAPVAP